jgi:mycofactocin system glycosyltransferase
MKGLLFSLAPGTSLRNPTAGYFLYTETPLRALKINEPLYARLQALQGGQEIPAAGKSGEAEGALVRTLLNLVSRGYLQIEERPSLTKYPLVSAIIPVKDQPADLEECLSSLGKLDYPAECLEVIVVDDGSSEKVSLPAGGQEAKLLRLEESQGPAAARNLGARNAQGSVLAFLDADCVADADWLKELLPFLEIQGMGGAGGYVASYFRSTQLDRYEAVASSLNMGQRLLFQNEATANFYVPTCNFLVRRQVFDLMGGFKAALEVGEDVDFCWRMRTKGYNLLYLPFGAVAHKHRNQLGKMLRRRFAYGTSEAVLGRLHPEKKKRFPRAVWAGLAFLSLLTAILILNPVPLGVIPLLLVGDVIAKDIALRRSGLNPGAVKILLSSLRSFFSLANFASFHLVRYYLSLLLLVGIAWHPLWIFCGFALTLSSTVDYFVKKPCLSYPCYLYFFALESLAYQWGVFFGCLRQRSFRSYVPRFGPLPAA